MAWVPHYDWFERHMDGTDALDLLDLDDPEAAVRTWLREGK